jgi:hypothetical protein
MLSFNYKRSHVYRNIRREIPIQHQLHAYTLHKSNINKHHNEHL